MKIPLFSKATHGQGDPMDVEQENEKPFQAPPLQHSDITLQLHPLRPKDALLVKVQTPRAPAREIEHVPCDIVLSIDVSASMLQIAPVPGETEESTDICVLDLTKHAALTIIETMNAQDRLGIVAFSVAARTLQGLEYMTPANKTKARKIISEMKTYSATNLWGGICAGLEIFKEASKTANVPALMVLTDGMPNHLCPAAGYIPKLQSKSPLPATIHTFGFGYSLRSGLLKSIAEIGGGGYAFIPDAGMIATVFVHAVANLQTTCATEAVLQLAYDDPVQLEEATGETVVQNKPARSEGWQAGRMKLDIPLGNLQYGQSRDIFLRVNNVPDLDILKEKPGAAQLAIDAKISFQPTGQNSPGISGLATLTAETSCSLLDAPNVTEAEAAYHESQSLICSFLTSLFPLGSNGERGRQDDATLADRETTLGNLIAIIPAKDYTDALNKSLMEDLAGEEPHGQISLAITNTEYFTKWGVHYLPSYLNAHTRQMCNSFKDLGPMQYGADSPLFIACRDRLDNAFDTIEPPKPTRHMHQNWGAVHSAPRGSSVKMSSYRNASGVCFAASTPVELASGTKLEMRGLRRGVKVRTPVGPRKVAMVLRTKVKDLKMSRVGGMLVTPWHPISTDGKTWTFPETVAEEAVLYSGSIYSILLQRDGNSAAHAMRVANTWGVTLGHGITTGTDLRAHAYFGDYTLVAKGLVGLGVRKDGLVFGAGVVRDEETGLVKGFKRRGGRAVGVGAAVGGAGGSESALESIETKERKDV